MKLLPLACFAASTAQYSGDYEYGGVDASEDDRGYGYSSYGNYDDYGNKKKNKNNYTFGYNGGRAIGGGQAIAVALNCWPANFDRAPLMAKERSYTSHTYLNTPLFYTAATVSLSCG